MKLGYPDTINNKAYQGETSVSPFKMVDKSKADLDKDGKVSEYESKRAGAAFGSEAPLNYSPIKADSAAYTKLKAANKAAAEKAKKAEAAIRKKQQTSGDSTVTPKKSKGRKLLGRVGEAIAARKTRRNDGVDDNPKVQEREIGRMTRKKNKKKNNKLIKEQKALVTKSRQDKKTNKQAIKQAERLANVTKKVDSKITNVKKGGLGINRDSGTVGNIVRLAEKKVKK